jgi:peptidoglycan/xylan/chitin deacetylase (PgdA/CDA1 family)
MSRRFFVVLLTAFLPVAVSPAQHPESAVAPPNSATGAAPSPSPTPAAIAAASPAPNSALLASAPGGYLDAPRPALKHGYSAIHVDGPFIAITFDDGPHATNTPRLLGMLAQRRIKATFFMVGQCAAEFPDIVKRIAAEGHEVANHSWSHPNLAKMSEEAVRLQLQRTQEAIGQACGITPKVMRPPYGSITDRQRQWITGDLGLKIIMWSVDPLDWKNRNAASVARRILAETRPGSIVLAHDIHATTVDAMPEVFDTLLARGFKFVTVSELIAMEKPLPPKPASSPAASRTSPSPAVPTGQPAKPAY